MSLVHFLIAFFLIRYIRQALQTHVLVPAWDKVLVGARLVAIVLVVAEVALPDEFGIKWLWHLYLLSLIGFLFWQQEFNPIRATLYAILPYLIISFLADLVRIPDQDRFELWANYIDSAQFFAFIWMVAMLINYHKQNKALAKERERTMEETQKSQIIEQRRLELESLVSARTAEISRQKEELQQALEELKTTQTQLIQREKLASLGELTAGIAHEIQNPLNFVNNFAEISEELCRELQEEIISGNNQGAAALATDIYNNQKKIIQHGQRADSIVKGMLQHSRASTSQKEPTDINALADEYLRLSYHGLRAKNKEFNARLITEFDHSLGTVAIVPQEIGRVLLNLFNNAFYAVQQKQKLVIAGEDSPGYEPVVKVSTKKVAGMVEIRVWDNGTGIPDSQKSKIFQPFFTTKPSGQGTGLGLSLSYEIITKGHGGQLELVTKEGEYAEFIIILPL